MELVNDIQEFGGPWTAIKIEILKKYLEAYTTALKYKPSKTNSFKLLYIDAFAGAGRYKVKKKKSANKLFCEIPNTEGQIKSGSAKTALEIKNPFHEYYFIDTDENNINHLSALKQNYSALKSNIHIIKADAGVAVPQICSAIDWRMKRAVLFLDPFKADVSWRTIEKIAKTKAIDMWFLFPHFAINRMLARDGVHDPAWQKKLIDVFGSECWKSKLYRQSSQMNLPGIKPPNHLNSGKKDTDLNGIKEYTIGRLKTLFAGVSPNPKILYNSTRSPLFILFFAVGNERGKKTALKIANNILDKT